MPTPAGNITLTPTPELYGGNPGDSLTQKNFESGEDYQFEDGTLYDFE